MPNRYGNVIASGNKCKCWMSKAGYFRHKRIEGYVCKETVVLHRWEVKQDNWVLSTGSIMWISHCKEIQKLTFRALALRRSDSLIHIIDPVDKTQLFSPQLEIHCTIGRKYMSIKWPTEYLPLFGKPKNSLTGRNVKFFVFPWGKEKSYLQKKNTKC